VIRTNLSTRPFYNERAVHLLVGLAAVLIAALTFWNIARVVALSGQNTELASRVNRDHAEAAQLTQLANEIRQKIDRTELQRVVESAREANALIDQRTFSWTAFFNELEATLPADVMLTTVRPAVKDGVTTVNMVVLGRRAEDIDEFLEKLEASGTFEDILPTQQDRTEAGLHRVVVESRYAGRHVEPEPAAPPVQKPGGAQ
jgi:Tfp pilus assembly protein PilN